MAEGSIIRGPVETAINWKDGGSFYNRYNKYITDFLNEKKIIKHEDEYKTLMNLTFTSPSAVASLISGVPENGWSYFKGLEDLRR